MSSFSRRSSPARAPSARPLSVRVTSTHPVNRFFWFHSLSPWRSRMRLYVMAPFSHDPVRNRPATATLTIRRSHYSTCCLEWQYVLDRWCGTSSLCPCLTHHLTDPPGTPPRLRPPTAVRSS